MVELWRIKIFTDVAIMSQKSVLPRLGHIEVLYHMFEYMSKNEMYITKVDESMFTSGKMDCKDLHGCIKEELTPRMTYPLSKNAHTTCFVGANHVGNVFTWGLHTGVLIYVMNTPIIWF